MDYSLEIHVFQNTGFTYFFLSYIKMRSMHACVFLLEKQNSFRGKNIVFPHTYLVGIELCGLVYLEFGRSSSVLH